MEFTWSGPLASRPPAEWMAGFHDRKPRFFLDEDTGTLYLYNCAASQWQEVGAGGGGGGDSLDWTLAETYTYDGTAGVTELIATGLDGAKEIKIFLDGLMTVASAAMRFLVSSNDGASYKTANGDYYRLGTAGQKLLDTVGWFSNLAANAATARGSFVVIQDADSARNKTVLAPNNITNVCAGIAVPEPINAVRVYSNGIDFSGGSIHIFTR